MKTSGRSLEKLTGVIPLRKITIPAANKKISPKISKAAKCLPKIMMSNNKSMKNPSNPKKTLKN
jgi:hypothetical protein